jgi:tellurite resistance-related uncharacterized protein
VRFLRRTAEFTAATVPPALTRDHATKAGVWGVLRVTRGRVAYRLADPDQTIEVIAGGSIVIEPEARHAVALSEDAAFFVEFHG